MSGLVDELSLGVLIACLALGIVLLAIELFIVPGFGLPGLGGLALMAFAIVFAFWRHGTVRGLEMLGAAVAIVAVLGYVAKVTVGKRLVLQADLQAATEADADLTSLMGQEGVAASPLRPAGVARFGERRVDVVTEAQFLEPGTRVVVVAVAGKRVVVEPRKS